MMGAPRPLARGGSRRKGSTCASEVGGGPSKSKIRKMNLGDVLPLAPASTKQMSVRTTDDKEPSEVAPQPAEEPV